MNPIPKFRAWHIADQKMCDVALINFEKGAFLVGLSKGEDIPIENTRWVVKASEGGRFCEFSEFILMQDTGAKDKNGIAIFAGDIVSEVYEHYDYEKPIGEEYDTRTRISFIEYKGTAFWIDGDYIWDDTPNGTWNWNKIEVIGNTYQNKELLTNTNEEAKK